MKQLDLLPPDFHKLRRRRRWVARASGLMMVLAASAALICVAWEMQQFQMAGEHRRLTAERAELTAQSARAVTAEQRYQTLVKQTREVDQLVPAVPLTAAVALVCHTLPESVSLYSLVVETQPREAEAPEPADKNAKRGGRGEAEHDRTIRLTISGHARDDVQIARFVSALGGSELLSKVQLGTSRQVEVHGAAMHEFQVTAEIAPHLKLVRDAGEVASGS